MPEVSRRARRRIGASLAVLVVAVALVGCTWRWRPRTPRTTVPFRTTTVVSTPTTDGHGHTDEDHSNMTTTTLGSTPTTDGHGHTDEDHANMTTTTVGLPPTTVGHGDHGH
jgi:hypothetical protein